MTRCSEYGPFGEVIRATGPMAKVNPFRFSTKYQDDETDLLYYGLRYYSAGTGRWLNHDPLGEMGGANIYGFVGNDPISLFDVLGLGDYVEGSTPPPKTSGSCLDIWTNTGAVSSERFAGGPLNGLTVTNRFDGYLRRTNVALLNSSQAVLASTGLQFDGASRLYRVSQPSTLNFQPVSATYSYVANSALVEQIEFARNGAGVMKTTNHWDKLNRLGAVASEVSGAPVVVHAYQYNLAGQRAAVTNVDNAFWVYSYDSLGQVTSKKGKTSGSCLDIWTNTGAAATGTRNHTPDQT